MKRTWPTPVVRVEAVSRCRSMVAAATVCFPSLQHLMGSDRPIRLCGGTIDTANAGSRAPAYPPIYMRCARGAHYHEMASVPNMGT
jgi:hypothetical protein